MTEFTRNDIKINKTIRKKVKRFKKTWSDVTDFSPKWHAGLGCHIQFAPLSFERSARTWKLDHGSSPYMTEVHYTGCCNNKWPCLKLFPDQATLSFALVLHMKAAFHGLFCSASIIVTAFTRLFRNQIAISACGKFGGHDGTMTTLEWRHHLEHPKDACEASRGLRNQLRQMLRPTSCIPFWMHKVELPFQRRSFSNHGNQLLLPAYSINPR